MLIDCIFFGLIAGLVGGFITFMFVTTNWHDKSNRVLLGVIVIVAVAFFLVVAIFFPGVSGVYGVT